MTSLFLTNDVSDVTTGSGVKWIADWAAGAAPQWCNKNTVTGPTAPLQITDQQSGGGADGNVISWYSVPLKAVTISGTITVSMWTVESNASANVAPSIKIERTNGTGTVLATIVNSTTNQGAGEMTTTSASDVWSVTAASTALSAGDRLRITLWLDDAADQGGAGSMATGFWGTFRVNGATGGSGQSEVAFSQTLTPNLPSGIWDGIEGPTFSISIDYGGNMKSSLTTGRTWTDLPVQDIRSVSIKYGQASEINDASVGTCEIELDNYNLNQYDPLNSSGGYHYPNFTIGKPIQVVANWGGSSYPRFRGYVTGIDNDSSYNPITIVHCQDSLGTLGTSNVPVSTTMDGLGNTVPNPLGPNQKTGGRLTGLFSVWFPWMATSFDAGISVCESTIWGDFGLNIVNKTVASELGWFWQGTDGTVNFRDRYSPITSSNSTTIQMTLSDVASSAVVEMLGMNRKLNLDTVFNDCSITRDTPPAPPSFPNMGLRNWSLIRNITPNEAQIGDNANPQQVQDATSVGLYGTRTFQGSNIGTLLMDDSYAYAMAQWIVSIYKNPAHVVSSVSYDMAQQDSALYPVMLGIDLLDRVRVIRSYDNSAFTFDRQLLICGYAESITPDGWTVTLATFDPARISKSVFTLDTDTLNSGHVGF